MHSDKSKKSVRDIAMEQLRKTRAELQNDHPHLFKALRMLVSQAQSDGKRQKINPQKPEPAQEYSIAIDRQKNLEAVIKYAALKPGSEKLKAQLKEFIN